MTTPAPSWLQEDFGPYRLFERLGVGGMASVYRAVHRKTGERVALKRLLPQLAGDSLMIKQFRREAEIANTLAHPNMACVHDFGEVNGIYYLTMEEIVGPSLLELLRRANERSQPAPIGVSLWILREILCALDYAMCGLDEDGEPFNIVHRDLSPSNVIINDRGEVKIIDFGVAKSLHGRYATNSGRVKGKLGYMSPEALAGRDIDSRSDLYSLAILGWELLTARRLFRGSERDQLELRARNYEQTPPSRYNHDVSFELDEVLATTLNEDPSERWSSPREMLRALEPHLEANGQTASPRALRAWVEDLMEPISDADGDQTSRVSVAPESPARSERTPALFHTAVTMPARSSRVPGGHRFKEEVHTEIDPIFDADARHRASEGSMGSVPLASGSSEFPAPAFLPFEAEPVGDTVEDADAVEARDPDTMEIGELVTAYVNDSY